LHFLITGATGFVGPYLVEMLRGRGHECRCLVRSESRVGPLRELGAELVVGDVSREDSLLGVADGMDYVVHMATLGHMSNFAVPESRFEQVNVQGTLNVMREALRAGVKKVLHCSSVAAMGICSDLPATEHSECRPHHAYGRSKLEAEQQVLRLVEQKGLPAVIARFSMIYGPGDQRDMLRLARLVARGCAVKIGRKQKLTPLIHVEDAARGALLALEKGRAGEIYLITNEQSEPFDHILSAIQTALEIKRKSLYVPEWAALAGAAVVESLCRIVGKPPPVTYKNIESTLADRAFSVAKAQRELGFSTRIDPEAGIARTVRWYRRQGWV
jgi:dihydroflavonol-4-reductase